MKRFDLGDVVQLSSGGPTMTVVAVSRSRCHFKCCYWDGNGVLQESRWLDVDVLRAADVQP